MTTEFLQVASIRRRLRDRRSRSYVIAGLAGCHFAPVLRWLDGGPQPSGAIGERVQQVADELGLGPEARDEG